MFMVYLAFFLTFALLVILGLYSTATGTGPAGLKPVQDPLRPVVGGLRGAVGTAGIIAVIWGVYGLISFILTISVLNYAALPLLLGIFQVFPGLVTSFILITVGCLAGYVSVAAFFGAPASGAGKFVDWFKRTFGANEAIVGLIALVLAVWLLIEFIVVHSGSSSYI